MALHAQRITRRGPAGSSPASLLLVILLAIPAIFFRYCQGFYNYTQGADQVEYLIWARRMLSGARLYGPTLQETNPPVIIWFSALPVLLGNLLHIHAEAALNGLTCLLLAVSLACCYPILRRTRLGSSAFMAALFTLALMITLIRLDETEFGQREQLMLFFAMPYLLAVATGVAATLSLPVRITIGLSCALGVWLKPQELALIIVLELLVAAHTRSLRRLRAPELLALAAGCAAILALIATLTPTYLTRFYPLLRDTYWAVGSLNTAAMILYARSYYLAEAAAFVLWFLLHRKLREPFVALTLLLLSLTASLLCDIQHTTWDYHFFPQKTFFLLGLVWIVFDLFAPGLSRLAANRPLSLRLTAGVLAALSLGVVLVLVRPGLFFTRSFQADIAEESRIFSPLPPQTPVFVFSTKDENITDVYNLHLTWASRNGHLWMLPAVLKNQRGPAPDSPAPFKRLTPARTTELAAFVDRDVTEDLERWRPQVVLVSHCDLANQCMGLEHMTVEMIPWFLQYPDFRQAWSHYRFRARLQVFDVYDLIP